MEILEALVGELGTAESRQDLSIGYCQVGEVYEELGGRENLIRALKLYQKALELREALAVELGTAESRNDLSVSCIELGSVYGTLGGRENLRRAVELKKRAAKILKALVRELKMAQGQGIAESRRNLWNRIFGGRKK